MIDERSCKDLSNKELAAKLKAKGVSVGPIGPTTRRLYERKLEKISAQEVIPKREYSDQDSSEPEEEEVEIEKPTPLTRSLRKRGTGESATKRPALYSRRGVKERNVEESLSESVPPSSGMETTKPERRWLPFWVTIAIVSIIVTILYFVYITMEENPPRFLS